MRWKRIELLCLSGCAIVFLAGTANAAHSLSNSLTGFTGDSTQAGTQAAVGAAGLNFFTTSGLNDNGTPGDPGDDSNPTVTFDSSGAHFGSLIPGDAGRNYMRTNHDNYASSLGFVAEITYEVANDNQSVFFGVGAGDTALFGTPDWSTQFSSASFWPETSNDKFTRFRTQNDMNSFGDTGVPGYDPGTHRFRMTFNASNDQLLGEIDINYAGGPFVADATTTNFPIVLTTLYAPDGWPSEPSRIFFGGDDGVIFRDLSITIVPEPSMMALIVLGSAVIICRRFRGRL
jgi:hypothetical protein